MDNLKKKKETWVVSSHLFGPQTERCCSCKFYLSCESELAAKQNVFIYLFQFLPWTFQGSNPQNIDLVQE